MDRWKDIWKKELVSSTNSMWGGLERFFDICWVMWASGPGPKVCFHTSASISGCHVVGLLKPAEGTCLLLASSHSPLPCFNSNLKLPKSLFTPYPHGNSWLAGVKWNTRVVSRSGWAKCIPLFQWKIYFILKSKRKINFIVKKIVLKNQNLWCVNSPDNTNLLHIYWRTCETCLWCKCIYNLWPLLNTS